LLAELFQTALLPSAKSGPANLTSSTASAISVRTAIMWLAPPRPHSKRIRHTRVHEGVAVRPAGSSIRACHHGISFALLDEVKESFTGKFLFDGLCLTGLISRACAGNQSAKSHSNNEGFHWLPIPVSARSPVGADGRADVASQPLVSLHILRGEGKSRRLRRRSISAAYHFQRPQFADNGAGSRHFMGQACHLAIGLGPTGGQRVHLQAIEYSSGTLADHFGGAPH
jgi:hypothetical protein